MPKYVNADAIKWVVNQYKRSGHLSKEAALNLVNVAIDAAPNDSVDAVEVVRCKDCRKFDFVDKKGGCGACGNRVVRANDFCSRGERKM